ncbi:MAG: FkbM family methyltransferase [Acidobacteriota bacterium]
MATSWPSRLFRAVGLRVRRAGADNRFDAAGDVLHGLARRGYRPAVVIDAGANRGTWTDLACTVFPDATFHLIEPQPARVADLGRFRPPRFHVHAVAVTRPGVERVVMAGVTGDSSDTGAYVTREGRPSDGHTLTAPASTFDALLAHRVAPLDRALLKLDLEGHELAALDGAERLLAGVEAIFTEVQFYDIEQAGHPTFSDVLDYLRARGFDLHDIAALASRPRDGRLRMGDALFVRRDSPLGDDVRWE